MSVMTTEQATSEITSPVAFYASRIFIYGALIIWAIICLFPIYWTITTSMKTAVVVTQGHLIPFVDFKPDWKGWRSLGLSPDSLFVTSTVREEFMKRFPEPRPSLTISPWLADPPPKPAAIAPAAPGLSPSARRGAQKNPPGSTRPYPRSGRWMRVF